MKLTVLGGGGVRSPLLVKSIMNRAEKIGITKVVFMDNNYEKLSIFGKLAENIAARINPNICFATTCDAEEALKDADYVITTLRVGGDRGRMLDETIALNNGVLGQETTGAGGFAMALRSVPALLDYCEIIKRVSSKDVLVFNFTNPSGLVTQALHDNGYDFVIGICDGPSEFIKELERLTNTPHGELQVECFGLNHLSWYRSIIKDGKEILPEILKDERLFTSTEMRLFSPGLVKSLGMLLNGYLYYYYHKEKALANISAAGGTRGMAIMDINDRMTKALHVVDIDRDFDEAMEIYLKHYYEREKSYMSIESGTGRGEFENGKLTMNYRETDNDGYAGVALNIVEGIRTGKETKMILSVPNRGAIEDMADSDIVEISCIVNKNGIKPERIGKTPEIQTILMKQIKLYEKLAVKAILEKDKESAIMALTVHPLVGSFSIAEKLVEEYLAAHRDCIGEW